MNWQSFMDRKFEQILCANFISVSESKDMQRELPQTPKILRQLYSLCKCTLD